MIKCLCAIFRDLSRCFSWRDDQEFPATDKKKNPSLFFSFSCFNLWLWITSRRCRLLRFGFKSHSSGNAFILSGKKTEHWQSSRLPFFFFYVKDGKWSFFDYDGTTIMRPVFSANQLDWGRLYNLVRDEKRSGVFGHQTTFVCQFFKKKQCPLLSSSFSVLLFSCYELKRSNFVFILGWGGRENQTRKRISCYLLAGFRKTIRDFYNLAHSPIIFVIEFTNIFFFNGGL